MATKVILPMLGQTMEEGTITQWLKSEGDTVQKGEALLEVMTDKVNLEVEAPESGILRKIVAQVDETVPIMALIAIIGTADEPIDDILAETSSAEPQVPSATINHSSTIASAQADQPSDSAKATSDKSSIPSKTLISPRARRIAEANGITVATLSGRGTGPNGRIVEKDVLAFIAANKVTATPLASKMAADQGVDLRGVSGTGPRGRVTKEDVLQSYVPMTSASSLEAKIIPFTGMRKMVGDNVAKSAQTAPHVTLISEVDMTETVKVRTQILAEFEKKYGTRLTFTDLIVKAVARAVLDHPMINASLQGNEIRVFGEVNVGVALALEGGLIVPVLHNAERKSLAQISVELKQLVEKGKTGKLAGDDISGGTISISNLGTYGVDAFNPIITPGQTAILGVCRIAEKPVVIGGQIVVRSMMNLCLSFDHRVLDGAPAAQYLASLKALLESPYQLLI